MFCTNCGNKLNENDKFCNLCGTQNIVEQSNQKTEINLIDNERDLTNRESDNLVVNMEKENKQEEKETRTEKFEIKKIKNTSVLKILSFISIAIFFLPIYSDWGWMFSILHSKEPTAVSVPIFTFSLILFIGLLTNIGTEKGIFKTSSILGAVNWFLSLFLIIPTPLHTQVNCLGSYVIFIVNLAVFIYGLTNFLGKSNIEYEHKASYTIEQQKGNNEIYKKTFPHRVTLKLVTLCALVAFVLPCALTSCDINDTSNTLKVETGIDIMSHFFNGIGNAFAITIFVLFVAILLALFIKRKPFIYFPFLIGITNVFMIVMTKIVFYKNIMSYLVGSYIMFIASIIISALGYVYYKKVTANDIPEDVNMYSNTYYNGAELQNSVINSGEGQCKKSWSNKKIMNTTIVGVLLISGILTAILVPSYKGNKKEVPNNSNSSDIKSSTSSISSTQNMKTFDVNLQQGIKFEYIDGRYNKRTGIIDLYIKKIVFNGTIVNFEVNIQNNSPAEVVIHNDINTILNLESISGSMKNIPQDDNQRFTLKKFSNDNYSINYFIADPKLYNLDKKLSVELSIPVDVKDFGSNIVKFSVDLNEPKKSNS